MTDRNHGHIGFLYQSTHVRCFKCDNGRDEGAALYTVNINHYGQYCHECRAEIQPPMPGWPELFVREDCRTCRETVDVPPLYAAIREHHGHEIKAVEFGGGDQYALECVDCCEVIVSCNREEEG